MTKFVLKLDDAIYDIRRRREDFAMAEYLFRKRGHKVEIEPIEVSEENFGSMFAEYFRGCCGWQNPDSED